MKANHNVLAALVVSLLMAFSPVSAHGNIFDYSVSLDGPSDGNASPGTGFGSVSYDSTAHTLQLQLSFTGLQGTTTASHIHAPTAAPFSGNAGVATTTPTFAGFPLGVTSGTYSATLDLTLASSYNPTFVTASGGTTADAEAALTAAMAAGESYWNVHSSSFLGGEIRGFLVAVPEPSSAVLLGIGGWALAWVVRRRKAA